MFFNEIVNLPVELIGSQKWMNKLWFGIKRVVEGDSSRRRGQNSFGINDWTILIETIFADAIQTDFAIGSEQNILKGMSSLTQQCPTFNLIQIGSYSQNSG